MPVVPHAGQMHNDHLTVSSVNCPMSGSLPKFDVEVGNELLDDLFDGVPVAEHGFVQLRDDVPGFGPTLKAEQLDQFDVIE